MSEVEILRVALSTMVAIAVAVGGALVAVVIWSGKTVMKTVGDSMTALGDRFNRLEETVRGEVRDFENRLLHLEWHRKRGSGEPGDD